MNGKEYIERSVAAQGRLRRIRRIRSIREQIHKLVGSDDRLAESALIWPLLDREQPAGDGGELRDR